MEKEYVHYAMAFGPLTVTYLAAEIARQIDISTVSSGFKIRGGIVLCFALFAAGVITYVGVKRFLPELPAPDAVASSVILHFFAAILGYFLPRKNTHVFQEKV